MTSTLLSPDTTPASAPARSSTSPAAASAPSPWYRREPWLAVVLAAYVPTGAGFLTPAAFHPPLIALSAMLVLAAIVLLLRQGPFRSRHQ